MDARGTNQRNTPVTSSRPLTAIPVSPVVRVVRVILIGLAVLNGLLATAASAQPYPAKPIRFTVGQSPGGATDLVARTVAQKMSETLGHSVVVENRTGAAGSIAAAIVAKATPDGYTALIVSSSYSINPSLYASLPFDPVRDLAPVTLLAEAPFLLVVHPSMPARTVNDLVAVSKSRPNGLNFASGGTGSSGHLAGELFRSLTGAKLAHIPYKGAGPALVDVIGGQVDLTFASMISSLSHLRSGKLKALAVTSAHRSPALPELVTVAESGVRGYATTTWYGALLPAATSPVLVRRLNDEIRKALGAREVAEHLMRDGAEPAGNSPEHFRDFLAAEIAKWRKVIQTAKIQAD